MTQKEYQELEATAKLLNCSPSDAVRIATTSVNLAARELAETK